MTILLPAPVSPESTVSPPIELDVRALDDGYIFNVE